MKEPISIKGRERNIVLKLWCDQAKGRTTMLSEKLFPTHAHPKSGLSHYKKERDISDALWDKMITEINKIDSTYQDCDKWNKINNDLKNHERNKPLLDDATYNRYIEWAMINSEIKCMLVDTFYKKLINENEHNIFSDIVMNKRYVDDQTISYIDKIINHADESIFYRDQYYLAALLQSKHK